MLSLASFFLYQSRIWFITIIIHKITRSRNVNLFHCDCLARSNDCCRCTSYEVNLRMKTLQTKLIWLRDTDNRNNADEVVKYSACFFKRRSIHVSFHFHVILTRNTAIILKFALLYFDTVPQDMKLSSVQQVCEVYRSVVMVCILSNC